MTKYSLASQNRLVQQAPGDLVRNYSSSVTGDLVRNYSSSVTVQCTSGTHIDYLAATHDVFMRTLWLKAWNGLKSYFPTRCFKPMCLFPTTLTLVYDYLNTYSNVKSVTFDSALAAFQLTTYLPVHMFYVNICASKCLCIVTGWWSLNCMFPL